MAENERKNEIIGANYAWNIRSAARWLLSIVIGRTCSRESLQTVAKLPDHISYLIFFIPPTQSIFRLRQRNDVLRGSSRVPAPRTNFHCDFSKSLTLSNLGEPTKVESLRTIPKFRNKGKFRRCLCTSAVHREIGHFHVVVVQCRQRNEQKSVMHVENCCFRLIKPIGFLALKFPNVVLMLHPLYT